MNLMSLNRRHFLQRSSAAFAGAAAASQLPFVVTSHAAPDDPIRVGVVGCGGRGTGAVLNILGANTKVVYPQAGYHTEDVKEGTPIARKDIQIVALADMFEDRLARCREQLTKLGIPVPKEHCFVGFDACERLLKIPEINYVILATPPHFRPAQMKAAIAAGKHVFAEKPVAVDPVGVRTVIEAGELAKQKGLGIAAGTQRRHLKSYQECIKRVHDGALGEIVYASCYWNGGQIWVVEPQEGWTDMEWQLRNWNYFTWLGGDHIVEQHVHNLDIMNWVLGGHPVKATCGVGGRQVRVGKIHGHIFDHFAVEFEYANGVRMFSQCRQINGCDGKVGEMVFGTLGKSDCNTYINPTKGELWRYREKPTNAYEQEHLDLIESIRAGKPINEAQAVAESTMTGILGRECVYSGKTVEWDAAMKSNLRLGPSEYKFGPLPMPEVALPGKYRFA